MLSKLTKRINNQESTFKKQYANHKISPNVSEYKNDTKIFPECWNLKAGKSKLKVTWAIKKEFSVYKGQSNGYLLGVRIQIDGQKDR